MLFHELAYALLHTVRVAFGIRRHLLPGGAAGHHCLGAGRHLPHHAPHGVPALGLAGHVLGVTPQPRVQIVPLLPGYLPGGESLVYLPAYPSHVLGKLLPAQVEAHPGLYILALVHEPG